MKYIDILKSRTEKTRAQIFPLTYKKILPVDIKTVKNSNVKYGFYNVENTSITIVNDHQRYSKKYYGKPRAKYSIYKNGSFICCANTLAECKAIIVDRFTYLILNSINPG